MGVCTRCIVEKRLPRNLDEVANVTRVSEYRYLADELSLGMKPADPEEFVPRFASDLGVPAEMH
ncbi:tfbA1 protein [Halogranum salarium B-1]|uniref:TfbA1 protein n=1 Tax=Halogranum salarium B-1 TaxID=1210908 RepID=J3JDJ0_9EURY|nr:tfbA1 protein [Halogranum salarium B-1]